VGAAMDGHVREVCLAARPATMVDAYCGFGLRALVDRIALPLEVAEVPILFWLVIWGARGPKADEAAAA